MANCSVRQGDWTLVSEAPRPAKGAPAGAAGAPRWQLFDLKTDPGQSNDVAVAHPGTVAAMSKAYDAWWESVLPGMVNEDAPQPAENPFKTWFHQQFGPDASAGPDCALPTAK